MERFSRRQALRRGAGLAIAGLAVPALSACGGEDESGSPREPTSIGYQLGWLHGVEWGGTYIAIDRGYFKEEGLSLKLSPGGPQTNGETRLAAGRAQIGVTYGVGVALANKEGADIRILAGHLQKSPSGIVSLAEDPVSSPQELTGKRLGVATNSVAAVDAFLAAVGVDKDKVEYVPVQENLSPLTSGDVDAFYSRSTDMAKLAEKGIEYEFIYRSDFTESDMSDLIGVTQRTLEQDRDMVVRFLRAEIRGWQDFVKDPAPAVRAAVENYGKAVGLTASEQRFQAERYAELVSDDPIVAEKGIFWLNDRTKRGILMASKAAGAPLDASVFDESVLEEAYDGKTQL